MTAKKTTVTRRAGHARARAARTMRRSAPSGLSRRWAEAWKGLGQAEAQLEKRVRSVLKKNRIGGEEVRKTLNEVGNRLDKERRQALRQIESWLGELQGRVVKERKALGRAMDDAVRGAMARLDIPTRREVLQLTRKVDELARGLHRERVPARTRRPRRVKPTRSAASA